MAKGMMLVARGDQEAAFEAFSMALDIEPNLPETLAWAAFVALNLGRYGEAEQFAGRLTQAVPANPRGYYLLANALRAQDRIEEALAAIDHALDLNPKDTESLVTKARLLKAWQMPALAEELYKRSMAIRPTPAAGMELAQLFLRDSHPESALEILQQIAPMMPKTDRPYAPMGEAYTLMHRFEEAEEQWELAKKYAANPTPIAQGQARVEIAAGRFDRAEGILFELIDDGVDLPTTFSILSTGRKMKADDLPLIERMASLPIDRLTVSEQVDLNYALGKSFDDVRDYKRAIAAYDEANRLCLNIYKQRRAFDRDQTKAFTDFLIEISTPERIQSLAKDGLPDDFPLFVVGMMRSGTTLTETILSAHSKIAGGGEQAFWTEHVVEFIHMDGHGLRYDHRLVTQFAQEYLGLVGAKDDSKRYVIDKNPGNYELAAILHTALPNCKFIHLKRHPVDNLLSIWMTPLSANVRFASDRSNLVFTYREHMRLVNHWLEVLPPDRFVSYRYEDLTSDPQTTISSMLDYLGLEREEGCFAPEKNTRSVLTPSVYQVRQPINRGSQERWKNYEPWLDDFAELLSEA